MLNQNDLNKGFREIMDSDFPSFHGHFKTDIEAAQAWTNVFQTFYLNMMLPISGAANPNLYSSLNIFKNNLLGAIKSQSTVDQFERFVQTLHLGVCNGVNMLGIYVTTPPTSSLILRSCFSTKKSAAEIAMSLATKIFLYVSSTFSTMTTPPYTVIKWI